MRRQMSKRNHSPFAPTPASSVLISESQEELKALRESLDYEIQPRGIIEQMYVTDIAHFLWETARLRRCKAAIINSEFRSALERLLVRIMRAPGDYDHDVEDEAEELAQQWFSNQAAKKRVSDLLKKFQLDE